MSSSELLDAPLAEARQAAAQAAPSTAHPAPRWARYFMLRGWIHLILLTGTLIFLFPFVWMVLTSLKTDDELLEGGWWPTVPRFRQSSPYARPPVTVRQPNYVTTAQWEAALPLLRQRAAELAASGDAAVRDAAATVLLERLIPRLPKTLWTQPPQAIAQALASLGTPDAAAAAIEDRTASLDLLGLQVRTLDAAIHTIDASADIASRWTVGSKNASLQRRDQTTFLRYDFADPTPVALRTSFEFPGDPAALHKLILSIRPDDSWHRLDATLQVGGVRWVSQRPTYLAQHRPMSVIFQPPSFDDMTLQARIWVPLAMVSEQRDTKAGQSRHATLTLTLTPVSSFRAAWAKITRNYLRAFQAVPFWLYVGNSVLLVALTTIGTLFSSTFVAYAFARLHWPGRSIALVILLSTMMLPPQVTIIPSFVLWRSIGWYNTLNPLWVPAFFGSAFFIFLMTQHMKTIPRELEEAARLDGLNAVATWYYIILPQVKPAAAAVAIMTFMWSWNEFLGPLIYLRDQTRFPLSLGLFALRLDSFGDWSLIMAANVLMTLPVMVIFFLCQRYFIEGVTMTGMKG